MRQIIILIFSLTVLPLFLVANNKVTISGFVTDAETGEALINAPIAELKNHLGVVANNFGYYSMKTNSMDEVQVECSYVGYQSQFIVIKATNDTVINFPLKSGIEIKEIEIKSGQRNSYQNQPATGIIEMKASMVEKIPSLLGEQDLARMMQLMPGVQSGKEGSGGLYVRGGTNDQNLILLDGLPIYNANHIGGFVSIFNPSSINFLKLYKSGFPAKYGSRLSSIIEVQMKNGNMQKKEGSYSLGTLTGNFSCEGPIKKDTSSFIIAGRRTVYDLFVTGFNYLNTNGKYNGGYNLWDLNAKFNKKLDERTRIYASFYKGEDKIFRSAHEVNNIADTIYKLSDRYHNSWGNTTASVRLNKVYSGKTFANYTLGVSNYKYEIGDEIKIKLKNKTMGSINSLFYTSITDYLFSAEFEHLLTGNHSLQFGLQTTIHQFSPSNNKMKRIEKDVTIYDSLWNARQTIVPEIAIYISDEYQVTPRLSANIGLRATTFVIGNKPKLIIEPRLAGNFKLTEQSSLKFSYSRMTQFTHLISNSDQALPNDFWLPSTNSILPEKSTQYSLGTFVSMRRKSNYEFSVDLFYKKLDNLVEIKGGTSFIKACLNWEDQILKGGQGYVVGSEFLIEKTTGKTTGWVAYTISKNMRKFNSINNNNWFPFRYDRRHQLSVVVNHEINNHVNFSATWVYMSGEAATLPKFKYLVNTLQFNSEDDVYETYGEAHFYNGRNACRTPPYHRLDFCFNFVKKKESGTRTWTIGLYNAYNHANPYYLFVAKNKKGELKMYAFSFFPMLPSINYSFKF
jgi:hypothetical protein